MKPNSNIYHGVCVRYSRHTECVLAMFGKHALSVGSGTFFVPIELLFNVSSTNMIRYQNTDGSISVILKMSQFRHNALVFVNGRLSVKNGRLWIFVNSKEFYTFVFYQNMQITAIVGMAIVKGYTVIYSVYPLPILLNGRILYGSVRVIDRKGFDSYRCMLSNCMLILTIRHSFLQIPLFKLQSDKRRKTKYLTTLGPGTLLDWNV